jgi:hypothetical protein
VTVQIVRVLVFGGTPVAEDAARLGATRRSTGPLQFTFLEGVAWGDDGLVYAWEVQTERELAAKAAEDTGETGPDLDRFRAAIAEARPIELPGLPTCRVVTLGADPVFTRLLVDAASFGGDVLELITGAPAAARAAISSPACRTATMTTTRTGRWIQPLSEPDGPRLHRT